MNLPFTKTVPTSPGYYVWRSAADCPERLLKIVLHQGLLLTDNAEHPRLMEGEWCELVAKEYHRGGLIKNARPLFCTTWQVGQIWMTEHEHFMKVDSIDDRGIAKIRMIAPIATREQTQRFIPSTWKLMVEGDSVQSGNENEVQTRKAASSQDLPAEPESCKTCRWFNYLDHHDYPTAGTCQRRSPNFVANEHGNPSFGKWPWVSSHEKCGDYQKGV